MSSLEIFNQLDNQSMVETPNGIQNNCLEHFQFRNVILHIQKQYYYGLLMSSISYHWG